MAFTPISEKVFSSVNFFLLSACIKPFLHKTKRNKTISARYKCDVCTQTVLIAFHFHSFHVNKIVILKWFSFALFCGEIKYAIPFYINNVFWLMSKCSRKNWGWWMSTWNTLLFLLWIVSLNSIFFRIIWTLFWKQNPLTV